MINSAPQDTSRRDRSKAHIKGTLWSGFEQMFSCAKKRWKEIVTAIALPFMINSNINGNNLWVYNYSPDINGSRVIIKHREGAIEGEDIHDALYLPFSPNPLHIYSHNNNGIDYGMDARPVNSLTTYDLHLNNTGFSGIADNSLKFYIQDNSNFSWKNIVFEINHDMFDIKNLIINGTPFLDGLWGTINLQKLDGSRIGVYNTGNVEFYNYCDFNRDRCIDGLDFKIFRENFNRNNETDPNTFGSYVGSDVNDVNAYTDINRSGAVDYGDLDIFKTYFKFPGDINLDGRVGLDDFAYLANDWNIGDANFYDLQAFAGDYIRDINEPSTW